MKLLLIEDAKDVAELIFDYLEQRHFALDYAVSGSQGFLLASENFYDCIILDLMLPRIDGLTVCKQLRENGLNTPIIMLTARDTNEDMLRGFRYGADDYIVKPFDLELLEARINAVVRRTSQDGFKKRLTCGPLTVDLTTRKVTREGIDISLNPSCFSILALLIRKYPAPASREEIASTLWKDELPDDDLLRKHIYQLRKILDKPFDQHIIKTLPKVGYLIEYE